MPTNLQAREIKRRPDGSGALALDSGSGATFPFDATRAIVPGSYYVSPTGSDANDGLSESTPWQTPNYALVNLPAGKTLYLMDGIHSPGSTLDMKFAGNNGTAQNRITVTSLPGHEPVISLTGMATWLNFDNKNYWTWEYLDFVDFADAIHIAQDATMNGLEFRSLRGTTGRGGDNIGLLSFHDATRTPGVILDRIKCELTVAPATVHNNTSGIYFKRSTDSVFTMTNCEMINYPKGLYFKHGYALQASHTGNGVVRDCIFRGALLTPAGYNCSGVLFDNCIFEGAPETISEADGGSAGDWNWFRHCTFKHGVRLTNQADAGDTTYPGAKNNKFTDCINLVEFRVGTLASVTSDSDYNLFAPNIIAHSWVATPSSQTDVTLAGWRAFNGSDANSIEGTPSFAGADFTLVDSYALAVGSVGKGAASDATDMGADVSAIGVAA